jgi:hypothetical protein
LSWQRGRCRLRLLADSLSRGRARRDHPVSRAAFERSVNSFLEIGPRLAVDRFPSLSRLAIDHGQGRRAINQALELFHPVLSRDVLVK